MGVARFAWLLVPSLGLAELYGHFHFSSRPASPEEWQSLRPAVERLRKKSELVVIAPQWAEPNARAAFGDAVMPLEDVARADESAYLRAIEVSTLRATAPELASWKTVSEERVGKFRLRVLENPSPARVVFDFVAHVAEARVVDWSPAGEKPCPFTTNARREAGGLHGDQAYPAARHVCAGGGHFVGVTVVEDEQWRGRRCIWAEPIDGAALSIRWDPVAVGTKIVGYGTLPFWTEREKRGAPVEMEVLVGGSSVGKYVHKDGDGWKRFEFPAGGHAMSVTSVELKITSRPARLRSFCFQADTR